MSTNKKMVTIREDRVCINCHKTIPKGSLCLTINKKYRERVWVCSTCLKLRKDILQAQACYDNVPFDDEGGAMAALEYLEECKGEYYERTGIFPESR